MVNAGTGSGSGDPLVGHRFSCSRGFTVCGKDYTVPIKLLLSEEVSTTKRKGLQEMRTEVGNLLGSIRRAYQFGPTEYGLRQNEIKYSKFFLFVRRAVR